MRFVSFVIDLFLLFSTLCLIVFRKMLEACYETSKMLTNTYETGIMDRQGFDVGEEPVWILGRQYDTRTSNKDITFQP